MSQLRRVTFDHAPLALGNFAPGLMLIVFWIAMERTFVFLPICQPVPVSVNIPSNWKSPFHLGILYTLKVPSIFFTYRPDVTLPRGFFGGSPIYEAINTKIA